MSGIYRSSLASHYKPCALAFFQPNYFEPSQSPQSQRLAFRLLGSRTISSHVSHPKVDADSELSQSIRAQSVATIAVSGISSRSNQFEPNQSPQSRYSGLHPIETIGATSVTTISVLCSSSNETNLSHVGHHNLGVPAFHLPFNHGNQFEPRQSPHTRCLAIKLSKQLQSCWSPILSVSCIPAQSSILCRAFQSVTSISVLTFQPIGSHQSEPRQLLQPQYLEDSLSAVLSKCSHDHYHLCVWLPAHSSTIILSHHSQPSIASSMSVYQPIALLLNELLEPPFISVLAP